MEEILKYYWSETETTSIFRHPRGAQSRCRCPLTPRMIHEQRDDHLAEIEEANAVAEHPEAQMTVAEKEIQKAQGGQIGELTLPARAETGAKSLDIGSP